MTENERREAEYRSILKMAGVAEEPKAEPKAEEKPAKKQSKGKK